TRAEQLVARGDLHQDGDAATRRDGHADQRNAKAEDFIRGGVEAETLVFTRLIPAFELDDELDPLRRPGRGDAEELLDIDDTQPAQLHMMARQFGARADQD